MRDGPRLSWGGQAEAEDSGMRMRRRREQLRLSRARLAAMVVEESVEVVVRGRMMGWRGYPLIS
jgi:hypothetical protein